MFARQWDYTQIAFSSDLFTNEIDFETKVRPPSSMYSLGKIKRTLSSYRYELFWNNNRSFDLLSNISLIKVSEEYLFAL